LYDTTGFAASDDHLRQLLRRLVRLSGLLEPHDHAGVRASASEVFALGELSEAGTLSQQELAERLGLEKSTVSRLVAGMERRGWLSRLRDPANRRVYRLNLTGEGEAAAHHVAEFFRSRHAHLLGSLTPAERRGLMLGLTGLARVAAAFEVERGAHVSAEGRSWRTSEALAEQSVIPDDELAGNHPVRDPHLL
jgi:DNA-binding MarR family transcriptional regulator